MNKQKKLDVPGYGGNRIFRLVALIAIKEVHESLAARTVYPGMVGILSPQLGIMPGKLNRAFLG